jgi:hypothetical protein
MAKTLFEKYKAIQKVGTTVEVPYEVWTAFGSNCRELSISQTDICLGEDYKSLRQARAAIEWYVNQLGGKVKWESDNG